MRKLGPLVMLALVIAALAALAGPASAHAAYKSSDPPDDGQVSSPPGEVTATFTEPLANGSYLQITDPCGQRVDEGDVRIVGYDMSVSMDGRAAGRYTVFYRAFSTLDPHVTEGTFGFTATAGEACAGAEEPSDPAVPPEEGSGGGGGGAGPAGESGASSAGGSTTSDSGARDEAGPNQGSRSDPARAGRAPGRDRADGDRAAGPGDDVRLAAEGDESDAPSVWDGIRLEPFLTGLLLAAIIGAAGGKMYAGIMGPRA